MSLHALSPELLAIILHAAASPGDVNALITASSRCLRAFNIYDTSILQSALTNGIAPEALYDALAVAHAPSGAAARVASKRRKAREQYFAGNIQEFPTDRASLVAMCQLQQQIDRFITIYTNQAHEGMVELASGKLGRFNSLAVARWGDWPPLSSSERGRLQTAFYRYELYCRLHHPLIGSKISGIVSTMDVFRGFVLQFRHWEVEEMLCVQRFLCRQVEGHIRELNDELYEAVLRIPGVKIPDVRIPAVRCRCKRCQHSPLLREDPRSGMVYFQGIGRFGLGLFGREDLYKNFNNYTSGFAARGLAYMSKMASATRDERKEMIKVHGMRWYQSLRSAVCEARYDGGITSLVRDPESYVPEYDDHQHSGTHGWRLFGPRGGTIYSRADFDQKDEGRDELFRDVAWVFWDAGRVQTAWVMEAMRTAQMITHGTALRHLERLRGKSALSRLRGTRIPESELDKLIDEFASY